MDGNSGGHTKFHYFDRQKQAMSRKTIHIKSNCNVHVHVYYITYCMH